MVCLMQGDVYMELLQQFTPWLFQQVRVYNNLPIIQMDYTIGPIPFK